MEAVKLNFDDAIKLIGDKEYYHVFLNPNGMLVGVDWSKKEIIDLLKKGDCQLAGQQAKSMKHGLAVFYEGKWHFVETIKSDASEL